MKVESPMLNQMSDPNVVPEVIQNAFAMHKPSQNVYTRIRQYTFYTSFQEPGVAFLVTPEYCWP